MKHITFSALLKYWSPYGNVKKREILLEKIERLAARNLTRKWFYTSPIHVIIDVRKGV